MADQIPVLHIFALGPPKVRLGKHLLSFPTCKMLTWQSMSVCSRVNTWLLCCGWNQARTQPYILAINTPAASKEYQVLFETKWAETIPFEDAKFSTSP
jgi:hypothetical protein